MKGDRYRCPNCGNVILEGDCVYTAVVCSRTVKCRKRHGGTDMVFAPDEQHANTAYGR